MQVLKLLRRVIADLVSPEYIDELRARAVEAEDACKVAFKDYKYMEERVLKSQADLSFMENERNELNRLLTEAYNEIALLRASVKERALKALRKRVKKVVKSSNDNGE
jgi:hypothetical protein